jgi:hypothetical protein
MSKKATAEILKLVKEIEKTNPSGEQFFDALDEQLKDVKKRWLITAALRKITKGHTLILSGGFGSKIAYGIDEGYLPDFPYVLFKGGVRKQGGVEILKISGEITKKSTFFDDSIYGGATFFIIRDWLKDGSGLPTPQKCFVIYDGCPENRPAIRSLFRYYDFFQVTPNFQF